MKTPYLSGSFRFDAPVEPADGLFAINVCAATGRIGLLRILANLTRGRFVGVPGCTTRRAASFALETDAAVPAEVDGEIIEGRRFEISTLPERLRVCR